MITRFNVLLSASLLALATGATAHPALAARHALLVGVSDYLGGVDSLTGPRNDVLLMYRTLSQAWGEDAAINVLADRLYAADYDWPRPEAELPTRANILAALDALAEAAEPGDEVLIYFSGHGSQAPIISDSTEADGLDEIFLPGDFVLEDGEDDATIVIRNHIRDDEIGAAVDRLVENGVFVWLVIDACHSGTMERSADVARPRFATLARDGVRRVIDLNVSQEPIEMEASRQAALIEPSRRLPTVEVRSGASGRFVGFYAALPHLLAVEQPMPRDLPRAERRQHGLLTWSLVQALEEGGAGSYADLARRVTARLWQINGAPQPMFAGALGETPMIEMEAEEAFGLQVQDRQLLLNAGQLEGIANGAIMAVGFGEEAQNNPIFFAVVARSGMETAILSILDDATEYPSRLDAELRRSGLSGERDLWRWLEDRAPALEARVLAAPVALTLRVARPTAGEADVMVYSQKRLVDRLLPAPREVSRGVALEIIDAEQGSDVRLVVHDDRLWFLSDLGVLVTAGPRQPYSLPIAGLTEEMLIDALTQMAKARNFIQVAERFAETATARNLRVRVLVEERAPEASGACAPHPEDEPARAPDAAVEVTGFDLRPTVPIRVGNCDRVWIELRNDGDSDLDISPFYIDPHNDVFFLTGYHDALYFGMKLRAGQTRVLSYTENTASGSSLTPVGQMRLMLLAVEGVAGADYATDFRHLAGQKPPTGQRTVQRRDIDALVAFLEDAAFPEAGLRSAMTGPGESRAGAILIPMETFEPEAG